MIFCHILLSQTKIAHRKNNFFLYCDERHPMTDFSQTFYKLAKFSACDHCYDNIGLCQTCGTATNLLVVILKCNRNMLKDRKMSVLPQSCLEECLCLREPIFCTIPNRTDWCHKHNIVIFKCNTHRFIVRGASFYYLTRRKHFRAQSVIQGVPKILTFLAKYLPEFFHTLFMQCFL